MGLNSAPGSGSNMGSQEKSKGAGAASLGFSELVANFPAEKAARIAAITESIRINRRNKDSWEQRLSNAGTGYQYAAQPAFRPAVKGSSENPNSSIKLKEDQDNEANVREMQRDVTEIPNIIVGVEAEHKELQELLARAERMAA